MGDTINAKIVETFLGVRDNGIFEFLLSLEWKGGGINFGGLCMGQYNKEIKSKDGWNKAAPLIMTVLDVVGVNKWEDLLGKLIRVDDVDWGTRLNIIGHIMDDKWLDLRDWMSKPTTDL